MIVSMHIPKTAGTSFGLRLESTFGARMLRDYGDWVEINTPEAEMRRKARAEAMRASRDVLLRDYDVIHGHFAANKYSGLFPNAAFIAFFRDPYQHAISGYQQVLRLPNHDHPAVKLIIQGSMTLIDSIAALPNPQSCYMAQMAIEDLAMVGLAEQYERSVALFEAVFGRKMLPQTVCENVNTNRQGETYPIDVAVQDAVDTHRKADVELYRRACEQFARLTARHGL